MNLYDYRDGLVLPGSDPNGKWVSERRCPECGFRMMTNGNGDFHCNKCGDNEHEDVTKYADLKYNMPPRKRKFGYQKYGKKHTVDLGFFGTEWD